MCAPYVQTLYKRSFECMTLELVHNHLKRVLPESAFCHALACHAAMVISCCSIANEVLVPLRLCRCVEKAVRMKTEMCSAMKAAAPTRQLDQETRSVRSYCVDIHILIHLFLHYTHIHIDSYTNIHKPYNWYTLSTHLYWLSGLSQRPCASCFSRFRYCHNAFHCGRWYAFINTASTTQRFCLQAIRGKTSPLQLQ